MSSAPPGWHLQPDGRERFWNGERWTDEFRDPTIVPTQAIPTDQTRPIPAAPGSDGRGFDDRYAPYPEAGGPLPDRASGSGIPGWLKGCGAVLVTVLVLAVIGLGVGWWLLSRGGSDGSTSAPEESVTTNAPTTETTTPPTEDPTDESTDQPTGWPSGLPTELPTELPTALPEIPPLPSLPAVGEQVEADLGEPFTLGPVQIQDGWRVTGPTFGFRTVVMTAVPTQSSQIPLVFTLVFLQGGDEVANTICTAQVGTVGEESDVACLPMRGEAENADMVRASGYGG